MDATDFDHALALELRGAHGFHTILLYGSRARGDATEASDIDVAGFADDALPARDARLWRGMYLDAFVYPTTALAAEPTVENLRFCGGRVVLDERGLAAPFLDRIREFELRGPTPLAADDAQMRRVWAEKTLARVRRGDIEAHYRRSQMLFQLLEEYFALRGLWYRGPKRAFAWLSEHAPETHARFAAALGPNPTIDAIAALVADVIARAG